MFRFFVLTYNTTHLAIYLEIWLCCLFGVWEKSPQITDAVIHTLWCILK